MPVQDRGLQGKSVTLENMSDVPAFFSSLNLVDSASEDVVPVLWSENYVTLGQTRRCKLTVGQWDDTAKAVRSRDLMPRWRVSSSRVFYGMMSLLSKM